MPKCKCRTCGKIYDELNGRGDWKGYCSQGCIKKKLRELGFYRKSNTLSEYQLLSSYSAIGSAFVKEKE